MKKLLILATLIFEPKKLSNHTIPVVVLTMQLSIDQSIAPVVVAPQTLLTPATKEVVADAASDGAWVNRTPQQVIRTGVDGSTPGNIGHAVNVKHAPSPAFIVIVATSPPCGLDGILQVANKWQFTSLALVGNTQNFDAVIDRNFHYDLDSASISGKVIGHKLSGGSIYDLYLRCRMKFVAGVV